VSVLKLVLDTILPPKGWSADQHRKFRQSFIPRRDNTFDVSAYINRTEDFIELCLRPKDLVRWQQNLASHGLVNNEILGDLLAEMYKDGDLVVRFRHYYTAASSAPSSETPAPVSPKNEPQTMTASRSDS
jgi:hypothetical protein